MKKVLKKISVLLVLFALALGLFNIKSFAVYKNFTVTDTQFANATELKLSSVKTEIKKTDYFNKGGIKVYFINMNSEYWIGDFDCTASSSNLTMAKVYVKKTSGNKVTYVESTDFTVNNSGTHFIIHIDNEVKNKKTYYIAYKFVTDYAQGYATFTIKPHCTTKTNDGNGTVWTRQNSDLSICNKSTCPSSILYLNPKQARELAEIFRAMTLKAISDLYLYKYPAYEAFEEFLDTAQIYCDTLSWASCGTMSAVCEVVGISMTIGDLIATHLIDENYRQINYIQSIYEKLASESEMGVTYGYVFGVPRSAYTDGKFGVKIELTADNGIISIERYCESTYDGINKHRGSFSSVSNRVGSLFE